MSTCPFIKPLFISHCPNLMAAVSLISCFRLNSGDKYIYRRQKHIGGDLTAFELFDNLSSTARASN